jgi:hypothetical protein
MSVAQSFLSAKGYYVPIFLALQQSWDDCCGSSPCRIIQGTARMSISQKDQIHPTNMQRQKEDYSVS